MKINMKNLLKTGLLLTLPLFASSCEKKVLPGVILEERYTPKYGLFTDESYKVLVRLSDGSKQAFKLDGDAMELDFEYNVGDSITIQGYPLGLWLRNH